MKPIGMTAAVAALFAPTVARAQLPQAPKVGEEYEIVKSYETSQDTSDGSSSGSSSGHDAVLERVVAVSPDGLELEYDLPKDATAEERFREWQFPARVFKPFAGPMQLLNPDELGKRVDLWLKAANWTRDVCGRWIFTWNAFRIECDPAAVIKTIEEYDLRSVQLGDGEPYEVAEALGPGILTKKAAGLGGATYSVVMEIDPEAVRRGRAESDVAVGEMLQKPVTLDAALTHRAKESISGTISIAFETDSAGNLKRRTKVIKVETRRPDGQSETQTSTETVERSPVSAPLDRR
jgi:hypothetical protein